MADYYLRHGAYTYSDTPTFGTAQEGNGKAVGLAVSATGRIVINSVPTSGAVTIMGASVSVTGVLNAASTSEAATALASNINTTTNIVNAGTCAYTPQLRQLVFAVATGSTVDIMTRAGGAEFNYASNSNVAIDVTLNNSPTVRQFGDTDNGMQAGVDGCWGYFANGDTAYPGTSSGVMFFRGVRAYGVVTVQTNGVSGSTLASMIAGEKPTKTDTIHVAAYGTCDFRSGTVGNFIFSTQELVFLVDDGTLWPSYTGEFLIKFTGGTGGLTQMRPRGVFAARQKGNFRLLFTSASNAFGIGLFTNADSATFIRAIVEDEVSSNRSWNISMATAGDNALVFYQSVIRMQRAAWTTLCSISIQGASLLFDECEFEFPNLTQAAGGMVALSTGTHGATVGFRKCKATGATPRVFETISGTGTVHRGTSMWAEDLIGFDIDNTLTGIVGLDPANQHEESRMAVVSNVGPKRHFRLESTVGLIDWRSGQGYPTLDAYLPDGTAWSYRFVWTSSNVIVLFRPIRIFDLTKTCTLSNGIRTIDLELLVNDAFDHLITKGHLGMSVIYTAPGGAQYVESTYPGLHAIMSSAALDTSSKSWTLNSFSGYVPRRIRLVTAQQVAANTEITVSLQAYQVAPSQNQTIFINPELSLS